MVDEAYELALRVEEKLARHAKRRPIRGSSHVGGWSPYIGIIWWATEGRNMVVEMHE